MRKYLIVSAIFVLIPMGFLAAVMSSEHYKIQSDSINIGGTRGSSANYRIEDTLGEIATGPSRSANYRMYAGFQQMQEVYISISDYCSGSVNMGSLPGLSGGATDDNGIMACEDYITFNVKTDDPGGYSLKVRATSIPALRKEDGSTFFGDYTPSDPNKPDFNWDLGISNSEFGLSPHSPSQVQKYKNNGSECGTGTNITDRKCWFYFSTADENIVNRPTRTPPSGEDTKLNLKAAINTSGGFQEEGNYQATIIVTAITN